MNYEFTVGADGLVDVALADDLPLMSEVLKDSIGTRPPRAAPQDGPSTYWIDLRRGMTSTWKRMRTSTLFQRASCSPCSWIGARADPPRASAIAALVIEVS